MLRRLYNHITSRCRFLALLVLAIFASAVAAPTSHADTLGEMCRALLTRKNETLAPINNVRNSLIDFGAITHGEPSVFHISTLPDPIIGKRLHLQTEHNRWWSNYHSHILEANDPQWDPRYFATTVGAETAFHFGFQQIDKNNIYVPDAVRFNWAINHFNGKLRIQNKPELTVRFYTQPNTLHNDNLYYLYRFSPATVNTPWLSFNPSILEKQKIHENETHQGPALPLGDQGHIAIHDMVHTAATLLPKELVNHLSLQAEIFYLFNRWLEEKIKNNPVSAEDKELAQRLIKVATDSLVGRIDAVTGNPNHFLSAFFRGDKEIDWLQRNMESNAGFLLYFPQKTPFELLSFSVQDMQKIKGLQLEQFPEDLKSHPDYEKFMNHTVKMKPEQYTQYVFDQIQNLLEITEEKKR